MSSAGLPAGAQFSRRSSPSADKDHEKFRRLVAKVQSFPPMAKAVVHPSDEVSLEGALEAARLKLIVPILVGPSARIHDTVARAVLDIRGCVLGARVSIILTRGADLVRTRLASCAVAVLVAAARRTSTALH